MKAKFCVLLLLLSTAACTQIQKAENPLIGNWIFTGPFGSQVITFSPHNIVTINNPLDGPKVFNYRLMETDKIELVDLDTNLKKTVTFKILGNYNAIKLGELTYVPYNPAT